MSSPTRPARPSFGHELPARVAPRLARRPADRDRQRHAARARLQGPRRRTHGSSAPTGSGIALFAGYFELLARRRPLASTREALEVGVAWLALTVAFEFGFGRCVAHTSWEQLLSDYDLRRGRLGLLVLACILVGPAVVRARRGGVRGNHAAPRRKAGCRDAPVGLGSRVMSLHTTLTRAPSRHQPAAVPALPGTDRPPGGRVLAVRRACAAHPLLRSPHRRCDPSAGAQPRRAPATGRARGPSGQAGGSAAEPSGGPRPPAGRTPRRQAAPGAAPARARRGDQRRRRRLSPALRPPRRLRCAARGGAAHAEHDAGGPPGRAHREGPDRGIRS